MGKEYDVEAEEEKWKVPQATAAMPRYIWEEIDHANKLQKLIAPQRDALNILTKYREKIINDIAELESNPDKTAEQVKFLDKLKHDIWPKTSRDANLVLESLRSLEVKQKTNLEAIRKHIKDEEQKSKEKFYSKILEDEIKIYQRPALQFALLNAALAFMVSSVLLALWFWIMMFLHPPVFYWGISGLLGFLSPVLIIISYRLWNWDEKKAGTAFNGVWLFGILFGPLVGFAGIYYIFKYPQSRKAIEDRTQFESLKVKYSPVC